ncbi:hypothetical protein CVT26_000974 [Gymnopilus dilepis]|uniref:F-box domain-containing protein n=1 Tax=Gymnopilus dilepis TaxID=231916 RepID=A0A409WB48_9AGAR|nr:hypothetical protein CVT26_000974 [Gymnopilus dilepis]
MVILPPEIIEKVIEELDASGAREALRSFSRSSKHYRNRLFHRLHNIIVLSNDAQIFDFYSFVKGELISLSDLPRVLIQLPPSRSSFLEDIMHGLLHSTSLQYLELREENERPSTAELRSLALQIVSTAQQHLTLVANNLDTVTWRFCQFVRHLELRNCSLALDYPPPGRSFNLPLETLSFSTDTGMESLELFDTIQVHLPFLTHLLLYFKPHEEGLEMFGDSFSTVLSTAQNLEDITVVYERERPSSMDYPVLTHPIPSQRIAYVRPGSIR